MKAVDFSRVIEYYIHLNNASITPILLTSIQHLVTPPPPPHTQDVSQPAQLQSALIYLVLARCNDSCRNAETVTSLVASVRQLLAQRPPSSPTCGATLRLLHRAPEPAARAAGRAARRPPLGNPRPSRWFCIVLEGC